MSAMSAADQRLGEMLVRNQDITPAQLQRAINEINHGSGPPLSSALVLHGVIDENAIVQALKKEFGVPGVNLDEFEIAREVLKEVPSELANKHTLVPVALAGNELTVAMADPGNVYAIDELRFQNGRRIQVVVAPPSQIRKALEKYYVTSITFEEVADQLGFDPEDLEVDEEIEEDMTVQDLTRAAGNAPVIKLVNLIILDAIKKGASDIHIEPFEKQLRVRYRIDGILYEVSKPPFKLRHSIISRIKIMAGLDISERRRPQDGRIKIKLGRERSVDMRINVSPAYHGEKVVIRILDDTNLQLDMTKLGFEAKALDHFVESLHCTEGLVLVTGPTGSGKTTTLYSALSEINRSSVNILTAEDPVEFTLFGVTQHQVNEKAGVNFAHLLRSFLRGDPDVILVGEIRDFETAEIAVKAALTGHLVLSTLHTIDAPSTIMRLLNMGIEPFLIASSLRLVAAQRLVRKLCQNCLEPTDIEPETLIRLGVPPEEVAEFEVRRARGCRLCNNMGYKGRLAAYEILPITEEIKEFIINGATASELKREAVRQGMKTLRMSALKHLKDGLTSIDEVVRVTTAD
jgi:type IV pilus assembly protein PilB